MWDIWSITMALNWTGQCIVQKKLGNSSVICSEYIFQRSTMLDRICRILNHALAGWDIWSMALGLDSIGAKKIGKLACYLFEIYFSRTEPRRIESAEFEIAGWQGETSRSDPWLLDWTVGTRYQKNWENSFVSFLENIFHNRFHICWIESAESEITYAGWDI